MNRPLHIGPVKLTWRLDASEQAVQQAAVDRHVCERELEISRKKAQVLEERLALAYDSLREARTKLDETLQDRLTELSGDFADDLGWQARIQQ